MLSNLALVGALVGAAQAHSNWGNTTTTTTGGDVAYTTEVVTEFTTFCPSPTTLTHGDKTYTVTEATTLTITDCPCTISKPVEPTGTPGDECSAQCLKEYRECQTAPDANQSYCASQVAECLGYNPFENGSFHTPTACSEHPEPTTTAPPQEEECAEKCTKAYNACRVAPGANMATCAAQYAECLNFNPFDGSNKTVTACSGEAVWTTEVVTHLTTYCPAPTTLTFDHSTYTVTEPTTLTISDCSCTVTKPVETHPVETHPGETQPVPTTPAGTCPEECTAAYRECQTAPDANQSFCASQIAQCLGYNPFENGSFVTPTACSAQPPKTTLQPSGTMPGTPGNPVTPIGPGNPTGDSPSTVPTAAADHLSPLKALGVLAAVALL